MKVSDVERSGGLLPGFLSNFVSLPQLSGLIKNPKQQFNSLPNQNPSADDFGPCLGIVGQDVEVVLGASLLTGASFMLSVLVTSSHFWGSGSYVKEQR